jgi:hypothetical protein
VLADRPVASERRLAARPVEVASAYSLLSFQGPDQRFQAGGLTSSRSASQDADRMRKCHIDGGLLFIKISSQQGRD